ncbi:hypothetical protein ACUWEX_11110 [Okibacterium fritillariae]|uniref:hypothetical protein n=1 Tax=Okibacterium fritillariae TaxID=123320 RepID=UPI004055564E
MTTKTTKTTKKNTDRKSRKKIVLACTALVVGGGLLIGGTSSNLTKTITDGPDKHRVHSEQVSFDFAYTSTGSFDADLTVNAPASYASIAATNTGDIPAQVAFNIDPIAGIDLTNPIYEQTRVAYAITVDHRDGSTEPVYAGTNNDKTLKEFLTEAVVTDDIVGPNQRVEMSITIMPADDASWSSYETAAAVDHSFGTRFTFHQLTGDRTSPLLDAVTASRNKTMLPNLQGGVQAWTMPTMDLQVTAH